MWPVTESRTVYDNAWIRVTEDAVTRPDGEPGVYGVMEVKRPSVFVVAISDAGEVALVTVDRHTVGPSVEVPAGGADVIPGSDGDADLLAAARRELFEETGLEASQWREIGRMNALNGVCRAPEHVYLATRLTRLTASGQEEEGISAVRFVPWDEVLGMVASGEISDGETVAALFYAALALGRVSAP